LITSPAASRGRQTGNDDNVPAAGFVQVAPAAQRTNSSAFVARALSIRGPGVE